MTDDIKAALEFLDGLDSLEIGWVPENVDRIIRESLLEKTERIRKDGAV